MAQGKNKTKAKLPDNVKHKTFNKTNKQNSAFQKRKSNNRNILFNYVELNNSIN